MSFMLLFHQGQITATPFFSVCSKKSLSTLQLSQNTGARILTGTRKQEHITPILSCLHQLPVYFKTLLITFKVQNGLDPCYFSDLLTPHVPSRALGSLNSALLLVFKSRLKNKGDRGFAIRATRLWNNLAEDIKMAKSISSIKSLLKNHFYSLAFL